MLLPCAWRRMLPRTSPGTHCDATHLHKTDKDTMRYDRHNKNEKRIRWGIIHHEASSSQGCLHRADRIGCTASAHSDNVYTCSTTITSKHARRRKTSVKRQLSCLIMFVPAHALCGFHKRSGDGDDVAMAPGPLLTVSVRSR